MLLTDFKQATEIDNKIENMHMQLAVLYEIRANLFGDSIAPSDEFAVPKMKEPTTDWITEQYELLAKTWQLHGLQIPNKKQLTPKLKKAQTLFETLQNHEESRDRFELSLIPPSNVYQSQAMELSDAKALQNRSWKLFAIYNRTNGIEIEDQTSFIKQRGLTLATMNMPGLYARDYAVFIDTHAGSVFDKDSWSMLPNELTDTNTLLCVSNISGTYHCMSDDADNPIGDNRFRPAMEIK